MQLLTTLTDLRDYVQTKHRTTGQSIGLVPTMGALHEGHLALLASSRAANDATVCSIFVNPMQFNNPDDLARYPRTLEADRAMLDAAGCDAVFAPTAAEMYPQPPGIRFDFGNLERVMEGRSRPGHFNGVGVVLSKLFHLVQPDRAYFGQKDLQQCLVVKRLIDDLNFPLELIICPTHREADGLAMSSRNRNLTPEQRAAASQLYQLLRRAEEELKTHPAAAVQNQMAQELADNPNFKLDYFEIADPTTLEPMTGLLNGQPAAICVAAFLGTTRLIDNLLTAPTQAVV
ncbi:MAG: pantoate--beta-alanine ligase [Cytophagaceae bacterium]|nr:pantoate--beta-alanine ligase [Cytophagaceae bacterium]